MEFDVAAQKILRTALLAMNEADATAERVLVQAQINKLVADAAAAQVINDAAIAISTLANAFLIDINELITEVGISHNPFRTRAIAKSIATRNKATALVAKNMVMQVLQTANLVAQANAADVVMTALTAKELAKNVAVKVLSDANSLQTGLNSQNGKLFAAAVSARLKVDIANTKLVFNSRQAKRLVDDAQIRARLDALIASQILMVSALQASAFMRNYVNYLILRNATLQ